MNIQAAQGRVCALTFKKEMRGFEKMEDGPKRDKVRNGRQIQSKCIVYTRETLKVINVYILKKK